MAKSKEPPKPPAPPPPAPAHLSERSAALWNRLVAKEVQSAQKRTLLLSALEVLDRIDQARGIIAREGMTTTTKRSGAVHVHPLVKVEMESRRLFSKMWGQLCLAFDPTILSGFRPGDDN